ncbi:hypothetical protein AB0L53_28910 [Nonomuraea sp. NPDC052129]|uniref:hypothetical protein n=1 Tax=Nonomuraea sp. NPDC052129 TaxID=3154651 RepID=UPI003416091A
MAQFGEGGDDLGELVGVLEIGREEAIEPSRSRSVAIAIAASAAARAPTAAGS